LRYHTINQQIEQRKNFSKKMKIFLETREKRQFLLKNGYFGGVAGDAKNDRKIVKKIALTRYRT
jgi:hypothetical protein